MDAAMLKLIKVSKLPWQIYRKSLKAPCQHLSSKENMIECHTHPFKIWTLCSAALPQHPHKCCIILWDTLYLCDECDRTATRLKSISLLYQICGNAKFSMQKSSSCFICGLFCLVSLLRRTILFSCYGVLDVSNTDRSWGCLRNDWSELCPTQIALIIAV